MKKNLDESLSFLVDACVCVCDERGGGQSVVRWVRQCLKISLRVGCVYAFGVQSNQSWSTFFF